MEKNDLMRLESRMDARFSTVSSNRCDLVSISSRAVRRVELMGYYGRPLSVSGRPCYILPMFFF